MMRNDGLAQGGSNVLKSVLKDTYCLQRCYNVRKRVPNTTLESRNNIFGNKRDKGCRK